VSTREVPVPATGRQLELRADGASAVVTEVGASVRVLRLGGREVLDGVSRSEPALGGQGQALVPWPNRLRDGRYHFAGCELHLPLTEPEKGNAIHGLGRFVPWEIAEVAPERATVRLRAPDGGGVDLWMDEHHAYLMLFTGDTLPEPERRRRSLAVEPMTCAPDAFRSGDGLRTLVPGQSFTCAWGIRAA
jgi:galactose mutarotase-like enzyme